jgi:tetratricopeptide (TPR) repeat protein
VADDDPPESIGTAPTVESPSERSGDDLGSAASLLRGLADAPGRPIGAGPLVPGRIVDEKYRVDAAIGEGGMGIVYRARDLQLERDVALKVGSALTHAALVRAQREAQALARLSHPNVVVVYEVGEVDGRVFVAMELVTGGTARAWAAAAPRTPRELLALYCAAGDGLAAAHAADIVHRDFKPDNVLVGTDGRPRVADFGLARGTDAPDAPGDADATSPITPLPEVTHAGAVLGTPAYMAPEQRAGESVDARADQYAFCAVVWQALTGERYERGAAPARKLARHVERALRRGLRVDPDERWPSMPPLLAELRRDPARRRRNTLLAAGAIASLAAAVIVPRALASRVDACGDGPAQLARAWSPARADRIRAAFAAIDRPWATRAGARAIAALDDDARRWAISYRRVCEAQAGWTELVRARATRCLGSTRASLGAVADVLAAPDRGVAAHADGALADLSDPDACGDLVKMSRYAAPVSDPARARAGEAIDAVVERARALADASHAGVALALLPSLVALAASVGDDSTRGEAMVLEGHYLAERRESAHAVPLLREAYFLGRDIDDDELTAVASRYLGDELTYEDQLDAADDWERIALADARHTGRLLEQVEVLDGIATLALRREHLPDALRAADRAVELARTLSDPIALADALASRAPIRGQGGDHRGEIEDYRGALAAAAQRMGEDHPMTLQALSQLGWALGETGQYDEAIAVERRTIAIAEANPSPDTRVALADATAAMGGILVDDDRYADAVPVLDRAIELLTEVEGSNPDVASAMNNRGNALVELGRLDEAIASYRDALSIVTTPGTEDAYMAASLEDGMSTALFRKGDVAGAEAQARAAVDGFVALHVDPAREAHARARLADALAKRGAAGADDEYARAVAQMTESQAPRPVLARIELDWASSLASRGERARAITLARSARDHAQGAADLTTEVDALLHDLGVR